MADITVDGESIEQERDNPATEQEPALSTKEIAAALARFREERESHRTRLLQSILKELREIRVHLEGED